MKANEILQEARDIIIEQMMGCTNSSIFPENCETNDYSITEENGSILIPTKFTTNGKRIFVEIHLNLTSD